MDVVDPGGGLAYVAFIRRGQSQYFWFCLFAVASCARSPDQPSKDHATATPRTDAAPPATTAPSSARDALSGQTNSYFRQVAVYGPQRGRAGVRVAMLFDGEPEHVERTLPGDALLPARLEILFKQSRWSDKLDPVVPVDAGGLQRVRLHESDQRVVFDLEQGAKASVFVLSEPHRIIVDVRREGATAKRARPVVLLDPGHGGDEPGAANDRFGLVEAEVALDLAQRTRKVLARRMPEAEVLLTRKGPEGLSLEARCGMANALAADVFVSIHLNAGPATVRKGGVTTFVLDATNDRQALRLAARENGTHSRRVTGVQEIFAKLHRRTQMRGSRSLAATIQKATLRRARTVLPRVTDRGVRSAMFYVLVGATMPAVLVEASFLTVESEARALTTAKYKQALADGIASGIIKHLESR